MAEDIFARELSGEVISVQDPEYGKIHETIRQAQRITADLNTGCHNPEEAREIFARLTGRPAPEGFRLNPPFYTDFGRNLHVGRGSFFNFGCVCMDRGGIWIGEDVLIGPQVQLLTISHQKDPFSRRDTVCRPISIGDRVWIGAGAILLPGVSVGENAIIGAGAVVTRDVPPNAVAVGNPARILEKDVFGRER